jgi:hypothetical protein
MDRRAHEDVTAAVAAHRELGSDYDSAIAEGLVERIGAELDKRIDARFASRERGHARRTDVTPAGQRRTLWAGIGIGAAATGVPALIMAEVIARNASVDRDAPAKMLAGLLGFWVLLLVVYSVTSWVRRARRALRNDQAGFDPASGHTRP